MLHDKSPPAPSRYRGYHGRTHGAFHPEVTLSSQALQHRLRAQLQATRTDEARGVTHPRPIQRAEADTACTSCASTSARSTSTPSSTTTTSSARSSAPTATIRSKKKYVVPKTNPCKTQAPINYGNIQLGGMKLGYEATNRDSTKFFSVYEPVETSLYSPAPQWGEV